MPPTVTIKYNSDLDRFYQDRMAELDARFHNYQPHHTPVYESEAEAAQRETYQAYAEHAADHLHYTSGIHK